MKMNRLLVALILVPAIVVAVCGRIFRETRMMFYMICLDVRIEIEAAKKEWNHHE